MKALYIIGLAALIGCGSGGRTESVAPADRNVITESELTSVPSSSLYDLIEKLRPNFVRSHGQTSLNAPNSSNFATVFVDGQRYGDIGQLRSLVAAQVQEVRYYDAISAQSKFGLISGSGVIDVTIKRGK
jgi:hypothetical protein